MNYRMLGKSQLKISEISFGCMSLHGHSSANTRLIHEAIDQGVNFFDTADLYDKGENEKLVGEALKHKRKDILIATKVGNQWKEDGSGWIWNPRKEYILDAVKDSLKRLQTDYIDLYQLHGGTIDDPIDETIEAFEILKAQGWIREYGISSIRPNVIREYVKKSNIVSVMAQYSLLDRRPEEFIFPHLARHNIGVLVRGALAKGLLVDKTPRAYLAHEIGEVESIQTQMRNHFSKEPSPAQAALKFCLSHTVVSSIVVGASNHEQLKENLSASLTPALADQELNALQAFTPAYTYESHR